METIQEINRFLLVISMFTSIFFWAMFAVKDKARALSKNLTFTSFLIFVSGIISFIIFCFLLDALFHETEEDNIGLAGTYLCFISIHLFTLGSMRMLKNKKES